jgi:hypothetical protein
MTNFVAASVQSESHVQWSKIPSELPFWIGVAALSAGAFYQKRVFDLDQGSLSLLDTSKAKAADKLSAYYSTKIENGDIDELEAADSKLRRIFAKDQ